MLDIYVMILIKIVCYLSSLWNLIQTYIEYLNIKRYGVEYQLDGLERYNIWYSYESSCIAECMNGEINNTLCNVVNIQLQVKDWI